jgi:hypothetical protein
VGFILVAYLNLVRAQNAATMRSQSWNATVPVIEAGIEEALTHLAQRGGGDLAFDGWTQSGTTYTLTRAVGENFYTVTITNYFVGISTNAPVIEARGYVALPVLVAAAPSGPLYAASGLANSSARGFLARGVRVTTKQDFVFAKGMVAKDTIDLNGNNIRTDSFDSSDPNYSTNGQYTAGKIKANGDVATNSSLTNSLNVGNAEIYGHVSTGPSGSVDIGPNGVVGDVAWHNGGNKGIQPGYSKDDMNVELPEVSLPFSGGAFTPSGGYLTNTTTTVSTNTSTYTSIPYPAGQPDPITTNWATSGTYPSGSPGPVTTNYSGTSGKIKDYTYPTFTYSTTNFSTNVTTTTTYYDYILDSGNYELASLSGKTYVRGDAVLLVTDTINLSGQDSITIASGKTLKLYMSGASANLGGNGVINQAGNATNFSYYGLPANTSLSISGNGAFSGTIYAPNADLALNGGGNDAVDFIGATITKTSTMNGHFNFHYDEALSKFGPSRGYIVTSWNEMTPAEVGTTQLRATVSGTGVLFSVE